MDFVLYEGREQIAKQTEKLMQEMLDRYGTGVYVQKVTLQSVQPPDKVQAAFDDAVKAGQDRERLKNEGQAYANDVVPRARGMASRLLEEANGYNAEVVQQAEGDASRFRQILVEYEKAPGVTRDRLYLDMMQSVLGNASKVLVDQKAGSGSLLYLPLDKLMQQARPAAPAPPAEPSARAIDAARRPSRTVSVDPQRARAKRSRSRERAERDMKLTMPLLALRRRGPARRCRRRSTPSTRRKYAIKFQLGEIIETQTERRPVLQDAAACRTSVTSSERNLTLDNPEPDRITTSEKKPLLVDFIVLWRITDVRSTTFGRRATRKPRAAGCRRRCARTSPRSSTSARCTRRSPTSATRS